MGVRSSGNGTNTVGSMGFSRAAGGLYFIQRAGDFVKGQAEGGTESTSVAAVEKKWASQ